MTSNHFKDWEQVKNPNQLAVIMAAAMREDKNIKGSDTGDLLYILILCSGDNVLSYYSEVLTTRLKFNS